MKLFKIFLICLIIAGIVFGLSLLSNNSTSAIESIDASSDKQLPALMPARIDNPYTDKELETISEIENRVLYYTNIERAAYGLQPLILNDTLSTIAREHSEDMETYAYAEHVDSAGRDPTDRIKETDFQTVKKCGDITYDGIGENLCILGYGRISGWGDVDKYDSDKLAVIMVLSLMDSDGHRENILNDVYTHIGIGVAYGYGSYWLTQDFW